MVDQEGGEDRGWLLEPAAADEVRIHVEIGSGSELSPDVRDALDSARARPQADAVTGAVAVGLSFGGHVAVLAASRLKLRACVAVYAGWLAGTAIAPSRPQPTGSLPLTGSLLILVGDTDPMVPISDIEALRRWHPDADVVTYPGVGHRFASIGRPGYDADAATDAWSRIGTFLKQTAAQADRNQR